MTMKNSVQNCINYFKHLKIHEETSPKPEAIKTHGNESNAILDFQIKSWDKHLKEKSAGSKTNGGNCDKCSGICEAIRNDTDKCQKLYKVAVVVYSSLSIAL